MTDEKPRRKFFKCPECGRLSVYPKLAAHGEDGYTCRHYGCEFFAYIDGNHPADVRNRGLLHAENQAGSKHYGKVVI